MLLPKNERQVVGTTNFMKGWIYGAPFSGKTTFLDKAPDPLNLNTDGNTKYVTMQRVYIRDEVKTEGRITKRKFAWEVFKDIITELEKGSDFKTIIVDLVEDTREMCRIYKYDEMGIQHESDSGFGKGWDIIKTEYLSTMRRLLNLDYNIFLVSHEDISKEITRKSGEKITRIAPNLQEALANKLAGMVDFVARVIVNDDETRTLSFKHDEVTFGGGRLGIKETEIPLEFSELERVYKEAISKANNIDLGKGESVQVTAQVSVQDDIPRDNKSDKNSSGRRIKEQQPVETVSSDSVPETAVAQPVDTEIPEKTHRRKKREVTDEEVENKMNEITMANGTPTTIEDALAMPTEEEVRANLEETPSEEPKTRRRKKRTEE